MLWHKTEFYPSSLQSVEDTNLVYISLPKVKMGEGNLTTPVKKTKGPHALPTTTTTCHPQTLFSVGTIQAHRETGKGTPRSQKNRLL